MSFFNSNITGAGGSGGAAGGLVTKFEKSVSIGATETAEIQISLKDDISNYADITNEQIIVDIANVGASEAGTATLTQSYDAEEGVLTITSDSSKIPFVVDSTVEVIVYVAGAVQLPPVPEYKGNCYKLGTGTQFIVNGMAGYKDFTVDNFLVVYNSMVLNVSVDGGGSTADGSGSSSANLAKSYNPETGVFKITGGLSTSKGIEYYGARANASVSIGGYTVYLVTGEIMEL